MVSSRNQAYSLKKIGIVLEYITKVESRHGIVIPSTCVYKRFGEKKYFNVRSIFYQSYFVLPVQHNILNHFFAWKFYYFTCLPIMEGDIVRISNYDYDKYFIIYEGGGSGVSCDVRVKEKHKRTPKENDIDE